MAALPIEAYIDACKAQHEAPVEQIAAALQNEQSLGVSNVKLVRAPEPAPAPLAAALTRPAACAV